MTNVVMGIPLDSINGDPVRPCGYFPVNTFEVMRESFVASFTISAVLSGFNPAAAFLGGGLGALASLVDAAVTPIFNNCFKDCAPCIKIIMKTFIVFSVTNLALSTLIGVELIDIVAALALTVILKIVFGMPSEDGVDRAGIYFMLVV